MIAECERRLQLVARFVAHASPLIDFNAAQFARDDAPTAAA
jgi:hypothetical protein